MNDEYVNPFLSHAMQVWKKELGCLLNFCGSENVTHEMTTEDVTAFIRITGHIEGHVLFGFNKDTASAIVGKILGLEVQDFNEVARSALGELANMITVNAVSDLAAAGQTCQMSPTVFADHIGTKITNLGSTQRRAVFISELGFLHMRVCLVERPRGEDMGWLMNRLG